METDWNKYYQARPFPYSPTRKITERLVISEILKVEKRKIYSIIELGGGDSYLYSAFKKCYPKMCYIVVDKSLEGVNKFSEKNRKDNIKAIHADLLNNPSLPQAELVYSLGLIEHFEPAETQKIIKAHFDAALSGGLVLITFPTPTWLYRLIRKILESLNWWPFYDERPLLEEEVLCEIKKHGIVLTKKMNWFIGLTQKIIVARKF